ncbi:hypothetical protein [Enterococcus sp. AZ192]|uniref:hypothetical protein n=1 Tax=unclassified Enterococcus TaxID=2608891 RepID=UPI003D268394
MNDYNSRFSSYFSICLGEWVNNSWKRNTRNRNYLSIPGISILSGYPILKKGKHRFWAPEAVQPNIILVAALDIKG